MKIKSIELVECKRFNLNHIKRLFITFNEKIQLILGTNGSGKSSLMKELSPLPANSSDYNKGGSKTIIIEHLNSIYCLVSNFENSQKHSFLKDGVELNSGGTLTVQRELTKKEFGITPEIHDLYVGGIKFHSMSVAQRRYWFTLLSHTDYTYAISVYNKIKEKLRDTQGALKINQSRLVSETNKILNPEQEEGSRQYTEYLKDLLSKFKDIVRNYYVSNEIPVRTLVLHNGELMSKTDILFNSVKEIMNKNSILGESSLSEKLLELESDRKANEIVMANKEKELAYDRNIIESLSKTTNESKDSLESSIKDIMDRIGQTTNSIKLSLNFADPDTALRALDTLYDSILSVFKNIPECKDSSIFTKDYYYKTKQEITLLENELTHLDKIHIEALNKKKNMESDKENNKTTCPKCNYVWSRGYIPDDYNSLLKFIESTNKNIEELNIKHSLGKKEIEVMDEFINYVNEYRRIKAAWPVLNSLWNYIDENKLLHTNPRNIVCLLEDTKSTLYALKEIESLYLSLNKNSDLLKLVIENETKDYESIKSQTDSVEEELFIITEKQRELNRNISKLKDLENLLKSLESQKELLSNLIVESVDTHNLWLKNQWYLYICDSISILEQEIDKEDVLLKQIDRQKQITLSIEKQNESLAKEIETLKIIMTELSPSEGLIAKGMNRFINVFLKEINNVLRNIWSYPLELILSDLNNPTDELDYKFAIRVNDGEPIPDINIASTAMKEVIDLGFKIVCMKYLKMSEYPIFLDEFGASMDSAHRHSSINTIKDLVQNSNFGQIFIISHYESSYGSFKGSDINVLCANNIVIPKDMSYNSNMVTE